jgi:hypothetical protein
MYEYLIGWVPSSTTVLPQLRLCEALWTKVDARPVGGTRHATVKYNVREMGRRHYVLRKVGIHRILPAESTEPRTPTCGAALYKSFPNYQKTSYITTN